MGIHYFLVVLVIAAIIAAQIYIFKNTKQKIAVFKSTFPDSVSSYSIVGKEIQANATIIENNTKEYVEDIETINISQIYINTQNPTLQEIRNALNMYLQKNKTSMITLRHTQKVTQDGS